MDIYPRLELLGHQIPYDYRVEVRNRFKGLDLIDRVPDELWNEVRDIVQETGIKTIPMEKKCKKQNGCLGRPLGIDGETVETVSDFIFLGSKITTDGDCSHKIKRCLLLGRQAMTNLDSILESRDFTLMTKVHLVKAMVFPLVVYGCESWTIKKAEH